MADNKVDLKNEGVHWDPGTSQSYGDYLQLDKLLNAQKPNSIEQDEMLFISSTGLGTVDAAVPARARSS